MKIGTINAFGVWDSKIQHPNDGSSEDRTVLEYEIELMISGNGSVFIDGKKLSDLKNTLLIAKPNSKKHSIFPYKTYFIHIDINENFEYKYILDNAPNQLIYIDTEKFTDIFQKIFNYISENGTDTDTLYFNSLFFELLHYIELYSKNNNKLQKKNISKSNNEKIISIIKYIDNHLDEDLSLEKLSKSVYYSPNYFQSVFKKYMSLSPCEYVQNARINKSKTLLTTTNRTIIDIAFSCGFPSQSYFSLIFKRKNLISPSEYRKLYRI